MNIISDGLITSVDDLGEVIDLSEPEEQFLSQLTKIHPIRVPEYYLSLIDENDPKDPIRKMAIPTDSELIAEGSYDTSGELSNTVLPGMQHKYPQTAVILATAECAMYCRHCFRKRLVGLPSQEILRDMDAAVSYISDHKEINNVLVTGGDPFTLETSQIERILEALAEIPHLDFVRFGTRIPVTFPQRLLEDDELLRVLRDHSGRSRRLFVVTQYNHPREVTRESIDAVDRLLSSYVTINNQTVLLKGVNDNRNTLADLQNKLVSIGVNPYYVFQCRPVMRVKRNFQVPLYQGYGIIEGAKKLLNGHSKRFRYIMSHRMGKIEILGILNDRFLFKYHQAKLRSDEGRIFTRPLDKEATWLDDLRE
ncbi:MAG: KamA family radical SAM protein [Candidatus Thorarchaeota archaeon SMTZ1-83]|nr:MAG: lysine 2,3-aminomutase [Candidatus Thorarchaeota archaeon SMTZ1-83]